MRNFSMPEYISPTLELDELIRLKRSLGMTVSKDDIYIRPMITEDLTIFKKWLYSPHVIKWYHEPLNWIKEIKQQEKEFNWIHHYIVEYENIQIGIEQNRYATALAGHRAAILFNWNLPNCFLLSFFKKWLKYKILHL